MIDTPVSWQRFTLRFPDYKQILILALHRFKVPRVVPHVAKCIGLTAWSKCEAHANQEF